MLVFTPLLVKNMGTVNYGLWSFSLASQGVIGVVEFGLGVALAKYIAEFVALNDDAGLSGVLTVGFSFVFIISVLVIIPLYFSVPFFFPRIVDLISSPSQDIKILSAIVRLSVLGIIPVLLNSVGLAIPVGLQHYEVPSSLKVVQNFVNLLVILIIIVNKGSVLQAIMGSITVSTLFSIVILLVGKYMLREHTIRVLFSKQYIKKVFSFVMFSATTGIGIAIFSSLDRVMVGLLLGASELAYYSILVGMASKFVQLSSTLNSALMPASSAWKAKRQYKELKHYFYKLISITTAINLVLGALAWIAAEWFLRLWLGEDFAKQGTEIFRILIFIYATMAISATAFHFADGLGHPWVNTIGTLAQGVGLIILINVLTPKYGLKGAAWANLISWVKYISVAFLLYWFYLKGETEYLQSSHERIEQA